MGLMMTGCSGPARLIIYEIKVYGAGIRFFFLYSAISSYKGKNIMLKVGTVNYDRFS